MHFAYYVSLCIAIMTSAREGYLSSDRPDDEQSDIDGSYLEDNGAPTKVERSGSNLCGSNDNSFPGLPRDKVSGEVFPTCDDAFTELKKAAHQHGISVKKREIPPVYTAAARRTPLISAAAILSNSAIR